MRMLSILTAVMPASVKNVMNTIPLIFNEREIQRTVFGGSVLSAKRRLPVSALLLNRGARHYRSRIFENLDSYGFESVVSMELPGENYDIENLAKTFPSVKFVIPQESLTIGEMINIGMGECTSPFVLVLWNDVTVSHTLFTTKLLESVLRDSLCLVPALYTNRQQPLPVLMQPGIAKNAFKVFPLPYFQDGSRTLYPFDFMGLYHRERFIHLGGFDYTIKSPYWQNLDFFVRAWLWGEEINLCAPFRIQYEDEIQEEDITPDESSVRFFLKNIAPQFNLDHAELPFSKFFSFLKRAPYGLFESLSYFNDARHWTKKNKYRFKTDSKFLIEMWEREH